jgi:hypothetical protein
VGPVREREVRLGIMRMKRGRRVGMQAQIMARLTSTAAQSGGARLAYAPEGGIGVDAEAQAESSSNGRNIL